MIWEASDRERLESAFKMADEEGKQTGRTNERGVHHKRHQKAGFFTLLQREAVFLTVLVEMTCT